MGYQNVPVAPGYQLFTVTFQAVAGGDYDVQNIKVVTSAGDDYATNNRVKMQKVSADGEYGTQYNYRFSKGGWCNGSTYLGTGVLMFADGEGVALYNGDSETLYLQVSGAVNLTPVSTSIPASSYAIIGNFTPVSVDLQDVIPYIGDVQCSANNKVKVQKVSADGEYGTQYNYRQTKGGWCNASTFIGRDVVTLAPGEAMAVYNGEASAITLKFPSPVAAE